MALFLILIQMWHVVLEISQDLCILKEWYQTRKTILFGSRNYNLCSILRLYQTDSGPDCSKQ